MCNTMKKIKILFCGLLVGLSVLSYLIATHTKNTSELFLSNVQSLSQDESSTSDCVVMEGYCIINNGEIYRGMKLAD